MVSCEFLAGADLSGRIRIICEADNVDCAVAFWGRGMRNTLFPRWPDQHVRIVCDIAMKGTPRAALLELGAPENPKLTVRDGLHAKVFISRLGAVVCSANASGNGVGKVRGEGGKLVEAGVFCAPGTAAFEDAGRFFKEQFNQARQVSASDLKRAPEWSREPGLPVSDEALGKLNLIERLRQHPERFERTSIALTTQEMDEEIVKSRVATHNKRSKKEDRIRRDDVFLQSEPGDLDGIERSVLLIHREGSRRGSVTGYVGVRPFPPVRTDIAIGKARWTSFCRAVGQPQLKKSLTPAEWQLIGNLMKGDEWLFTAERFAALLSTKD